MSKQMTLGTGFEKYSKTTRREKFLTEMDRTKGELGDRPCEIPTKLSRQAVIVMTDGRMPLR